MTRIEHPSSPTAPTAWAVRAEARLWDAVLVEKVGDADMAETVPLLISYGLSPQYNQVIRLVASDVPDPAREEDCIGVAEVTLPMADNPRLADINWTVRSDRRGEGVGTALLQACRQVAAEHHRSILTSFTWEPRDRPDGAQVVAARTGAGAVDINSRESRFLLAAQFQLNQVERISRMELAPGAELSRLRDEVRARTSPEYETLIVPGPTPDHLIDDAAALRVAMSTDVPHGELDLEPEAWDAARVRASDAEVEAADREQLQTLVRHIPSGRLVAFTRLFKDRTVDRVAHQWETLVVAAHRGHGLGMLCKVVNHAAVANHWPTVTSLITGNASENRHMLGINIALGYQPYARVGFWTWP